MSQTEVSQMRPPLVLLAALIGRDLRGEKADKPFLKYGQAALAKNGEDYFLIKLDCLRIPGNASTSFSVFAVYPLLAATGVAVGICGMQLFRNITSNPEVRVLKEKRAAGVLDNFAEGERSKEHGLRKYVRTKQPQIMPSINDFFSKPDLPNREFL